MRPTDMNLIFCQWTQFSLFYNFIFHILLNSFLLKLLFSSFPDVNPFPAVGWNWLKHSQHLKVFYGSSVIFTKINTI